MKTKQTRFRSVHAMICRNSSPTFVRYWKEMRRHKKAVYRIYRDDKHHKHVWELIGSVGQVNSKTNRVYLYECKLCGKSQKTRKEKQTP